MSGLCKGGRPLSLDAQYARQLGISTRAIKRFGGAIKLQAMEPEARNLLLGDLRPKDKDVGQRGRYSLVERRMHQILHERSLLPK